MKRTVILDRQSGLGCENMHKYERKCNFNSVLCSNFLLKSAHFQICSSVSEDLNVLLHSEL